ncbi:flagellar hook-associated protein FlgK [Aequoribacter sp.]|uniref:flagellar hook-associated protein FlgK n=1 Tax=Aequoribacter sp. TaxID=2847771 RepID=UPI003C3AC307
MSDLLQLGANGIRLYQSALKTVSNNIANASTPGYSRQTTVISEATPVPLDRFYVGTGALVDRIARAYDGALEASLRDSSSDLSAQGPMIAYTNRVLDIFGSQAVGLTDALDKFFTAAENLSVDPASSTLRTLFLNEAEGLASRFNELSGQVERAADDSQAMIEQDVADLNGLGEQLVRVNQQLGRKLSEDAQPAALLDQRDSILRDMAAIAKLNIETNDAGQVTVKLGGSSDNNLFVTAARSYDLSATFATNNAGNVTFTLDATGANRVIAGPSSGTLAGAVTFRAQVLQPSTSALDTLAQTFADEVNTIHQQGLDANGNSGGELFSIDPAATHVAGSISVALTNPATVATAESIRVANASTNLSNAYGRISYTAQPSVANYQIRFDTDTTYSIFDSAGNQVSNNNAYDASAGINHDGLTISLSEAPRAGDEFTVAPNTNAAGDNSNLQALIGLRDAPIMNGTESFADNYLNIVNNVGSKARFSEITQEALQVVYNQAVDTKDDISGVNLDQEAADLIRFQQAYQASAQVIQTANRIFDSILSAS